MIQDVIITPLKIISDHRGSVMHMMRKDSKVFKSFGEIYFSTINENSIKAWHLHKNSTLNYACVYGSVKLVLYDDREKSTTKGEFQEIMLSVKNYVLVTIPPNIWNGFKGLGQPSSIIANCLDLPHHESEMIRINHMDKKIDYEWGL